MQKFRNPQDISGLGLGETASQHSAKQPKKLETFLKKHFKNRTKWKTNHIIINIFTHFLELKMTLTWVQVDGTMNIFQISVGSWSPAGSGFQ